MPASAFLCSSTRRLIHEQTITSSQTQVYRKTTFRIASENSLYGLGITISIVATIAVFTYLQEQKRLQKILGNRTREAVAHTYKRFYQEKGSDVSLATFTETMRTIEIATGLDAKILRPDDDLSVLFPELDLTDLLKRFGDKFNLQNADRFRLPLDARVDSLARYFQECRDHQIVGLK